MLEVKFPLNKEKELLELAQHLLHLPPELQTAIFKRLPFDFEYYLQKAGKAEKIDRHIYQQILKTFWMTLLTRDYPSTLSENISDLSATRVKTQYKNQHNKYLDRMRI